MPWCHCGHEILDDAACPTCGIRKLAWTVQGDQTRVLQVRGRWQGDAPAQVRVLQEAHADAVPFCEKCQESQQAPPEADEATVAQVAALKDAQAWAVPFCEKCQ
jgi:hypothetical protein